ncbi:MAG: hypothetical protein J6K16_00530 [Alphaproteobacteria bacterium]|nr:hypothetical protein [Alphaproteobacteria bacterium]
MTDFVNLMMKKEEFDGNVYQKWAEWCNQNQYKIVEKEDFYFTEKSEKKEPDYQAKRRMAYPDIGEQLDMIYWDKVNQTNIWADTINKIKTDYPKE